VLRWRDADGNAENGLEETLYYTNDANMNVTALVNASGTVVERYAYDPYGKPLFFDGSWNPLTASAYANEILYCGYRWDPETGVYHVRYRPYHPALGRWTSRDSRQYIDGMNLYEHISSKPVEALDPDGCSLYYPSDPSMNNPPESRFLLIPYTAASAFPNWPAKPQFTPTIEFRKSNARGMPIYGA
jgi:RHS repeat-associated protein